MSTIASKINGTLIGYLPISKLHSILAVGNLLAHKNISQICYCGQISLQSAAVNCSFCDTFGSTIYFAGDGTCISLIGWGLRMGNQIYHQCLDYETVIDANFFLDPTTHRPLQQTTILTPEIPPPTPRFSSLILPLLFPCPEHILHHSSLQAF